MAPSYTVAQYIQDLRAIHLTGSATAETSYYPPLSRLFNSVGESLKPKILFSTQLRNMSAGIPDGGFFTRQPRSHRNAEPDSLQIPERGVVEVKPAEYSLDALAAEPQTRRYLGQYGLVLITNLREFRLLKLDSGIVRTLEIYKLASIADLWNAPIAFFAPHAGLLPDFIARVMLYRAPLVQPKDVAWLLASYAREARARAESHPLASFHALKLALQESLGITFEGDKGEHFFRSTLVQTLFYGIFSAWVLWRRSPAGRTPGAHFDWRVSQFHLRVPVLRKLFSEVSEPGALNSVQLQQVLNLAGEALNRVQPAFFDTFREDEAVAYFYEPFLEAFDPQLRKDLGVWYTPKEIVNYMVERVDHLLRTQLHQPHGLASPAVRILDPCCGTGAYLTAVLHRIHRTLLENAGDDAALVPNELRTAALTRVFGFEIMPAPFVIAHLQLASLLETAGAPIDDNHRAGVFLTNALTGWVPERHPQSVIFEEFRKEREDSEHIKQQGTILVILGNPPYNGYAGIAKIEEERDLTHAYRAPVPGLPAPQGHGLNDLYIRFFRIAERRIIGDAQVSGNREGCGIVCLISNNAWLDGLSHTSMRHRYLNTFQSIYIDNLNGDKYRTGKTTPEGKPDPSAFSTPQNREGIQVGTAITTLVRTSSAPATQTLRSVKGHDFSRAEIEPKKGRASAPAPPDPETTPASQIFLRDIWGAGKLAQLERESKCEETPTYSSLAPSSALGNPFANRIHSANYTSWPRLPELFPFFYPGIKTSRDPVVVDIDREQLVRRMNIYLDERVQFEDIRSLMPIAGTDAAGFDAKNTRATLLEIRGTALREAINRKLPHSIEELRNQITESQVIPFNYRPFDNRWLFWTIHTNLIDRKREDYFHALVRSQIAFVSAQSNRKAFDPPTVTRAIASLHVVEKGSAVFPLQAHAPNLFHSNALYENISELGEAFVKAIGKPEDIFFHAIAIMHSPRYRDDNTGALMSDWPRIPLTASAELLAHSAKLGRRLAELLDAESPIQLRGEWSFLAALKLPLNPNLEEALKITVGWGSRGQGSTVMPGRGQAPQREWTQVELEKLAALAATQSLTPDQALSLLGETCVDVHINGSAFWSAVPIKVWEYTLGGYQVLKKWLSYRELPLLGRPLKAEEAAYFSQVVRRIAAILLLGPALDRSYQAILPTATGLRPT